MKWVCRCGETFILDDVSHYVEGANFQCPQCWKFFQDRKRLPNLMSGEYLDWLKVVRYQDERIKREASDSR